MFLPKLIIILLAFQWIHSADKEDVFERSYKYFGKTMESFLKTNPTANVSENCRTDLLTYSNYLQKLKKRRWALKSKRFWYYLGYFILLDCSVRFQRKAAIRCVQVSRSCLWGLRSMHGDRKLSYKWKND